jgi:hypothetical protein
MIREPTVAGQFYPSSVSSLKKQIENFIDKEVKKEDVIGVLMPHAGYIYSGRVAGSVASRIKFKQTFIILGPNHTGYGKNFSIMVEGAWRTPLGSVQINAPLAKKILDSSNYLEDDFIAHRYEHSIEVELPFLQYFKEGFKIIPIVVSHSEGKIYKEIGKELAVAIKEEKQEVVIIASSDMTHYEPYQIAKEKDQKAIESILKLDEDELLERIEKLDISMCGYAPCVVMLSCIKILGAKNAKLIMYQTSGDTSGDYSSVVGYAGIVIS